MAKPSRKPSKKVRKISFEEKFEKMVEEFNAAKLLLDSLEAGSAEHSKQQKLCDSLFAKAERFVNAQK
ncbi:hypothetical protein [Vibrio sonorensis]|uniref:hypothetical protein n=1 Tax=Vibrio sonorensis TaxID=1004316 RepID=UPI0008DAD43E|nr:hypothetical protein [Vibrio sonorensis]